MSNKYLKIYLQVLLLLSISSFCLAQDKTFDSYNGAPEITTTGGSITLKPNFAIPSGSNVRIYTKLPTLVLPPIALSAGVSNNEMNWTQVTGFDPNHNVISASKSFFDSRGQLLQSQTKNWVKTQGGNFTPHVFATQPVYDANGRASMQTLAAPINSNDFAYKADFVQNSTGSTYDYRNFDQYTNGTSVSDKTENPDKIGGSATVGTLGWFYGNANNWEPYTSETDYPFSREVYYRDGTGTVKKSAGPGEVFKVGSGHEVSSYTVPVANELDDYLRLRNKLFNSSELGNMPTDLKSNAIESVARDANGKQAISIADKDGHTLMSATSLGNELSINNSYSLSGTNYYYEISQGAVPLGDPVKTYSIISDKIIRVYNGTTLKYEGIGSGWTDKGIPIVVFSTSNPDRIVSSSPFQIKYASSCPDGCSALTTSDPSIKYLELNKTTPVTISGTNGTDYLLYNMSANESTLTFNSGSSLDAGYYKLVATSLNTINVNYARSYSDVSYSYYNQLGQLVASITPEGVKKLYGSGLDNYNSSNKSTVPFITLYEYDLQGRLVKVNNADAGTTEFVYRQDGKIRFSQNALQKPKGRFSYTNYDGLGRALEAGEYLPGSGGIAFNADMTQSSAMKNILENTNTDGGLTTGTRYDVVRTHYDNVDNSHGVAGYTQDEFTVAGATSYTEKYSTITDPNNPGDNNLISRTWFSNDMEGHLLWEIRKIVGLGTKTVDYSYDNMDRITKSVYQKGTPAETFVHYYEYNGNQQLYKVYTNTEDNTATRQLQATYTYYMNGPLKRMELGDKLQGLDYTYTLDGKLKAVNNSNSAYDPGGDGSNGVQADAFGMVLDYYTGDYKNTKSGTIVPVKGVNASNLTTDSYTGQLKAMSWRTKKPNAVTGLDEPNVNVYNYDDHYRFVENTWGRSLDFSATPANFTATNFNKETIKNPTIPSAPAYDANGNILYLQRTGVAGAMADKFTYHYKDNSNQLTSVTNSATGTDQTYGRYEYDVLGQLSSEVHTDEPSKNKYLRYDVTGKVTAVYRDAAMSQLVVEFLYSEDGARIAKKSYNTTGQLMETTWYVADVIYSQPAGGTATVQEYAIDGGSGRIGTYYRQSNVYAYEMRDQLGNVRSVIAKSSNGLEVRMYNDYYPYGMTVRSGGTNYRYGYQGAYAEKDGETDWNAFELRMYDSRIARWMSYDPAGQYASPYVAMGNDPANSLDPDGGEDGPGKPGLVPVTITSHPTYSKMSFYRAFVDLHWDEFKNGNERWNKMYEALNNQTKFDFNTYKYNLFNLAYNSHDSRKNAYEANREAQLGIVGSFAALVGGIEFVSSPQALGFVGSKMKWLLDPRVQTVRKGVIGGASDALSQIIQNKGLKNFNISSVAGNVFLGNPIYSGFVSTITDQGQYPHFLWNFGVNVGANAMGNIPGMMFEAGGLKATFKTGGGVLFTGNVTTNMIGGGLQKK